MLTARGPGVLDLLREGPGRAQIAGRLHISAKTVDHRVSAILARLCVRTRPDAARYGQAAGPR